MWLNNPVYPLEASGTSGMKAGINGVLNLSVLDGWWGEGYEGDNFWAIKPASDSQGEALRDDEEARTLYELLQDKVIPLYYARGAHGYSPGWVAMAKRSIATITPRFNSARMVGEYCDKFYRKATEQWKRYSSDNFAGARAMGAWKARIRAAWPHVSLEAIDEAPRRIAYGDTLRFEVAANLGGLTAQDVVVEVVSGRPGHLSNNRQVPLQLSPTRMLPNGNQVFALDFKPDLCGKIEYSLRIYPYHADLTHPFEMGLMQWL